MADLKISLDKLQQYINNKQELYEATLRNGYYLPNNKSSIITEEYLLRVIEGTYWCPLYKEIRLLPCPRPLSKQDLIEKLKKLLDKENKLIGLDDKHSPDKQWMIHILSTFNPKEEIFDKNYIPPAKKVKNSQFRAVDLPQNFIKGLPISKKNIKTRRLKIIGISKNESRLMRMKESRLRLEKIIELEKQKLEDRKKKLYEEESKKEIVQSRNNQQVIASKTPQK